MLLKLSILKNIKYYLLIILLFSLNKADNIEIKLGNETISETYLNVNETKYFKIIPESESYQFNYIKIIIEEERENLYYINHVVSYYQQDSTFNDRKQLSQNVTGTTVMWLTKEQIKNEFYLSVECAKKSCNYIFIIIPKDEPELYLNEQYTYYVTEENKDMKFKIIGNPELKEDVDNIISIWAKGDKDLSTKLEGVSYEKHSKYNAYIIKLVENKEFEYEFTINAKEGDLINLGSLFYQNSTLTFPIKYNGMEFSGFLNENISHFCYSILSNANNMPFTFIDYEMYQLSLMPTYFIDMTSSKTNYMCLNLPYGYKELFFTAHYHPDNKPDGQGMNKYSPQSLGFTLAAFVNEGETIGLIPKNTVEDYNYFTYHVNSMMGKVKKSFYKCENYPLCNFDSEDNKNSGFVDIYHSWNQAFKKSEMNNSSSISKTQNVLLLTCEKGAKYSLNFNYDKCLIFINMYTDKNSILLYPNSLNYHHILKGNVDNFISTKYLQFISIEKAFINIEVLSGNISVKINNKEIGCYNYENKYLYEINLKDMPDIDIKVEANENSIYDISNNLGYLKDNKYLHKYSIGANYLVSLQDYSNNNILIHNYYNPSNISNTFYSSFNPINCKINASYLEDNENESNYSPIEEKYTIYQHAIELVPNNINYCLTYDINKIENISDPQLFIVSSFSYKGLESFYQNGIYLSNGISHTFIFNQENNFINFIYPYIEYEKDVIIRLNLINEGNYKTELFINYTLENNNISEINNSQNITIEYNSIKSKCPNTDQICIIIFNITSIDNNESALEINMKNGKDEDETVPEIPEIPDDKKNNEGDNLKYLLILTIICVVVIFSVILIVVAYFYRKNKKLKDTVENTSFVGNKELIDRNDD